MNEFRRFKRQTHDRCFSLFSHFRSRVIMLNFDFSSSKFEKFEFVRNRRSRISTCKKKDMKENARTRSTIDLNDRFSHWERYVVSKILNRRNFYEQTRMNEIVNDCAKFSVFQQKAFVLERTQLFFTELRVENENTLHERKLCASVWFDRDDCDFFQKFNFCSNERTMREFDLKDWVKNDFSISY